MSVSPLVPYYVFEVLSYGMMGGFSYLAWRLVRAYERRSTAPERLEAVTGRMQVIEESIEQISSRVEQTAEAQRFMTHALLSGASGDRVVQPQSSVRRS
jgi:hypothetical protein